MKREEMYTIEYRKKIAKKYGIPEQEVIDLSKRELEIFVAGLQYGEMHGAAKLAADLRKQMELNDAAKKEGTDDKSKSDIFRIVSACSYWCWVNSILFCKKF